jgi:hypothetical protein
MEQPTIFTIYIDQDYLVGDRIRNVKVGNARVSCTEVHISVKANKEDELILHIPMRYVNFVLAETEDG